MLRYNCKVMGGDIPEGEFIMVEIEAENAGYALPLAIVNYPKSFVKEITVVT